LPSFSERSNGFDENKGNLNHVGYVGFSYNADDEDIVFISYPVICTSQMQGRHFAKIISLLPFERKRPRTRKNEKKNPLRKGVEKERRNAWIRSGCTEAKICNRVQRYKGACTHKCTNHVSDSDR